MSIKIDITSEKILLFPEISQPKYSIIMCNKSTRYNIIRADFFVDKLNKATKIYIIINSLATLCSIKNYKCLCNLISLIKSHNKINMSINNIDFIKDGILNQDTISCANITNMYACSPINSHSYEVIYGGEVDLIAEIQNKYKIIIPLFDSIISYDTIITTFDENSIMLLLKYKYNIIKNENITDLIKKSFKLYWSIMYYNEFKPKPRSSPISNPEYSETYIKLDETYTQLYKAMIDIIDIIITNLEYKDLHSIIMSAYYEYKNELTGIHGFNTNNIFYNKILSILLQ